MKHKPMKLGVALLLYKTQPEKTKDKNIARNPVQQQN